MNRPMTRWLVRVGALLALLLGSVPLLSSPSYAVTPVGGCWVWFAGPPSYDISSKLAPWANPDTAPKGPADHKISLSPSAPQAGSTGTITYSYNKGPENAGPPAQVTGTFRFTVNGGSEVTKTVDFGTISSGQSIPGRTITVPFKVQNGVNKVVFESVTFDAAAFSVKIDCNGQTQGDKTTNPRSKPLPTNVTASVTATGTAPPTEAPDPTTDLCLPDLPLPLPIPNPLACAADGDDPGDNPSDDPSDDPSSDPSDNPSDDPSDGSGGDGPGSSSGVPGSPATGNVDFDCVLQPFNSAFDYKPSASVGGARPSPGAPVGVLARFGDLPGIAPVPIDGPMEVTANLTVGGVATKVTGKSNVTVPPKTPVPVPNLTGSVTAAEDTLPVVLKDFSFYFPSFDITGSCKAVGGQDLGDMKVGSGTVGGAGSSGTPSGSAPGDAPAGTDPGTATSADTPDGVTAVGSQDIAVVDVRLEGSRSIGELFGAAPQRTLVLVVQNVGSTAIEKPSVSVAMGRSTGLTPAPMDVAVGTLAPQQMQRIEVPMAMPRAGMGTFHLAGQVGSSPNGHFGTTSQTYPWGLFLLNAVAAGIAGWGLRRRLKDRRTSPPAEGDDMNATEATIDLSVLDRLFARPRRGRPGLA